jgi:hypothetical protein
MRPISRFFTEMDNGNVYEFRQSRKIRAKWPLSPCRLAFLTPMMPSGVCYLYIILVVRIELISVVYYLLYIFIMLIYNTYTYLHNGQNDQDMDRLWNTMKDSDTTTPRSANAANHERKGTSWSAGW